MSQETEPSHSSPQNEVHNIATGLKKTRSRLFSRIKEIFITRATDTEQIILDLEETLIASDLGVRISQALLSDLRQEVKSTNSLDERSVQELLKASIRRVFAKNRSEPLMPVRTKHGAYVILVVGVNGVGKTTTIGKLAKQFSDQGKKVLLAACDTFRAAAVEQIQEWGLRSGVDVVTGVTDAKPATVAFQAVHKARDEAYDVLIVDTAGRLHTRVNLMIELQSVINIIKREQIDAPQETLLVLDATTGQNALQQAKEFNNKAQLTGVIVTKLDGTAKGGIVVAIHDELAIPIRYIGVGESADDLKQFSAVDFVEALFSGEVSEIEHSTKVSEHAKVRRNRRHGA